MKLSLRDLLWMTLVAALCAGWFVDRRSLTIESQRALLSQKDNLIRAFVKERNEEWNEGSHIIFSHPDEPHPNDPNVPMREIPVPRIAAP